MIRVLVVDDHPLVRQGIRAFLEALEDINVCAEASSGTEAIALAQEHVPEVILMDLMMPDMDGVETTRRVKEVSPRSQVMMLTSYHDDEHIFPALRAGALSYILKDASLEQLAQAIRNTARAEVTLHPRVASKVIRELQGPKDLASPNPFTELTDREMNVLKNLAEGFSNADIAKNLAISEYTVKGHVSNILSKLHLHDRTQAAVLAWRQGVLKPN